MRPLNQKDSASKHKMRPSLIVLEHSLMIGSSVSWGKAVSRQSALRTVMLSCAIHVLLLASASAHSWYPNDCCSGFDCMPADSIHSDRLGKVVVVGKVRVRVPANFSPRPSPDGRVHVCFTDGEFGVPLARCLFLPPEF